MSWPASGDWTVKANLMKYAGELFEVPRLIDQGKLARGTNARRRISSDQARKLARFADVPRQPRRGRGREIACGGYSDVARFR